MYTRNITVRKITANEIPPTSPTPAVPLLEYVVVRVYLIMFVILLSLAITCWTHCILHIIICEICVPSAQWGAEQFRRIIKAISTRCSKKQKKTDKLELVATQSTHDE